MILVAAVGFACADEVRLTLNFDPFVVATEPAHGATGVDLWSHASVRFSEPIDLASVGASTLRITDGSTTVPVDLTVSGSNAIVTFSSHLDWLRTYVGFATTGLADVSGRPLQSSYSWSFTTRDLVWTSAAAVASGLSTSRPVVAPDGRVWVAIDAGGDAAVLSIDPESGEVGPVEVVDNRADPVSSAPALVVDDGNNVVVAWTQSDGVADSIWTNRRGGGSWSGAQVVETAAGAASMSALVTGSAGTATVVFEQAKSGGPRDVWASRFTPASGWSAPVRLDTSEAGDVLNATAASTPSGVIFVAWAQFDGPSAELLSSRFLPDAGWSAPATIGVATKPYLVVDAAGRAISCFYNAGVFCDRYDAGWAGWSHYENINGTIAALEIDSATGRATMITNVATTSPDRLEIATFEPGVGWSASTSFATSELDIYDVRSALGPRGTVVVTYSVSDDNPSYDGKVVRLVPGIGWSTPMNIEDRPASVFRIPMAFRSDGIGVAVWSQSDGAGSRIWVARLR